MVQQRNTGLPGVEGPKSVVRFLLPNIHQTGKEEHWARGCAFDLVRVPVLTRRYSDVILEARYSASRLHPTTCTRNVVMLQADTLGTRRGHLEVVRDLQVRALALDLDAAILSKDGWDGDPRLQHGCIAAETLEHGDVIWEVPVIYKPGLALWLLARLFLEATGECSARRLAHWTGAGGGTGGDVGVR